MRTHSVFALFLILSSLSFSIASDSLNSSQFISGNTTLVSARGAFRLGFFSPGNSRNSYLGIWFNNIPKQTFVWVANRDNPIYDSTGILKFANDGNLILVDQTERLIWSSNTTSSNVNDTILQLLDTGNLVVRNAENIDSFIWESFDQPCDTMLAKMKLGLENLETGSNKYLTSWENPDDPSSGQYTYGFNATGIPQLVLLRNGNRIFRSGLWNGVQFSGILLVPNSVYVPKIVINSRQVYYEHDTYSQLSSATMLRLSYSGALERLVWDGVSLEWNVVHTLPRDRCDGYNFCGPNAFCDVNMRETCNCLTGYEPRSPQDWKISIRSGGCIRRDPLNCTNGEGFVELAGMKMPDLFRYWKNPNMTIDDCRRECIRNCTCTAYTSLDVTSQTVGCLLWFDELVDVRRLIDNINWTLYLRVSASDLLYISPGLDSTSNKKMVMIALLISGLVAVLLLVASCVMWRMGKICQKRLSRQATDEEIQNFSIFSLAAIKEATCNFSPSIRIGEGGFGSVYKGLLSDGVEIAVKRLAVTSGQGFNEFKNEVTFIAKLQHKNLVRLLGYCMQGAEKMLVYEYMSNGSLDSFIFDNGQSNFLDWKKRYDIIIGIARGLLYLHRDSRLRIIHRDLKASNILLDNEMNPKISDFGTARVFGADQSLAKTRIVIGTYGYMSPEYAIDGVFSVKSDVFSFGVLVLEIVSGKRNRQFRHPDHDLNLLGHTWKLWSEGKALELLDPVMADSASFPEVRKCVQVGLLCVQHRPEDRPTMSYVLSLLDSESVTLPQPKLPGFYTQRISDEDENGEHDERNLVTNALTNTLSVGR